MPICHQAYGRRSIEYQQHLPDANASGNVALLRSRPATWFSTARPRWRMLHIPRRVIALIGFGKCLVGHVLSAVMQDNLSVGPVANRQCGAITLPMMIGHTSLASHSASKSYPIWTFIGSPRSSWSALSYTHRIRCALTIARNFRYLRRNYELNKSYMGKDLIGRFRIHITEKDPRRILELNKCMEHRSRPLGGSSPNSHMTTLLVIIASVYLLLATAIVKAYLGV